MTQTAARRLGAASVLLLVLAACGDDTPSADAVPTDRDAYVSAAVDAMDLPDQDNSRCLAGTVVDAIGMDRIVDAELTPDEFARATSFEEMGVEADDVDPAVLQQTLAGCGDLVALFGREASDADVQACLRGVMTNDLVAESMVDELTGGEAGAELSAALVGASECTGATPATG